MRAGRASRRLPAEIARLTDRLLDFVVLAFAAWTVVYHLFLVLDLGAVAAAAAGAAAAVPSAWLAFRDASDALSDPGPEPARAVRPWPWRRVLAVLAVYTVAAAGVAAIFASDRLGWWTVWSLLAATAAVALALAAARATGRIALDPVEETGPPRRLEGWAETVVVLAWAVALATLSLFLVRPAADDTYYGRQASWIAEHGELPLRDVLFSDEVFQAIIYPPVSSIEALVGTAGHLTGLAVPDLLFFLLTPLASALSVLAMLRVLRRWAVPLVGLSLSVALLFLLMTAQGSRTFGNLFIGRIWEGKIVFI
ncbi:MAG TPA: hypothetical protein VFR63_01375, partial [Gaiellaceae bacterium]|nr:hypothetical protein [Gaiellaceae bacterium]